MVKKLEIHYEELQNRDELSDSEKELFNRAVSASEDAYAPYSKFKVGCALLLENGAIILGNNQENAAYPLGLCAERVAFFNAGANQKGQKIKMAAIYAESELFEVKEAITPCGACRQAMSEYENIQNSSIRLLMGGQSGNILRFNSVEGLLPLQFGRTSLHI